MELELEPRVKPLAFKVKAMSRESPSQKAANVLDSDLRTHWSTGTNTKEWILLELDEPCLLSHIRIYNKSVLEWEITAGLRYKPETFVKVRPRCEAPRRDMFYPMNYTACRYIRISCLRGNPIAIFFIQLIGVSVVGLEPEFQPIISYLLPHIVSHKEDAPDLHLQLLQDISKKLSVFLPQLENDLNSFSDAADLKIRFFAMLVGPFYPVLHLVNQRALTASIDLDSLQNRISSGLTISSNFEVQPRRSRSPLPPNQTACNSIVFRSESVFILLRKAYENSHLGTVCLIASRALQILLQPIIPTEETIKSGDSSTSLKEGHIKSELASCFSLNDYSGLFGEDFRIYDDHSDGSCTNLLDIFAVEEAILHFLYAAASEPMVCHTLAENVEELWSLLPLIQALLPALRPPSNDIVEQVDETFSQWKIPLVQRALAQIASVSSSMASRSLLRASAGYLLSFQQSQARAACMLIDLHFGPFAPWTSSLVMKIDLAVELLEGLLNAIQLASQSTSRARAALKYVILGLSGHMDDVLAGYKEVKHKVLFLVEMLEPFLDPAISTSKAVIKFGDVPATVSEKQKRSCDIALNVIRTAVGRAAVLPSLESEWRLGTVSPSVLLSILGPHMTLPDEIDCCKCTVENIADAKVLPVSASFCHRTGQLNESDLRFEPESLTKTEVCNDGILLFAPVELRNMNLTYSRFPEGITVNKNSLPPAESNLSEKQPNKFPAEALESSRYLVGVSPNKDLKFCTDYLQLMHLDAAAKRASEFKRLAFDLHLQVNATPEGHSAAVDALLLAAECYVNPLFSTTFGNDPHHLDQLITSGPHIQDRQKDSSLTFRNYRRTNNSLESLMQHETKRDKIVLELLLKSAKWESEYHKSTTDDHLPESENFGQGVEMSVEDMDSADAVTLLRQNQALLCHFLVTRLLSGQQCRHEVLLQALSFYLQTATELFCPPEDIVEIILRHAEDFNGFVTSFYHEVTNYSDKFDREKLSYRIHRRWDLLQNLVIASSRSDIGLNCRNILNVFHYGSLVPLVSWIWKMPAFSSSPFPLVRYVGWMAISNFAKQYTKEQLFFSSDLSSITNLLSIFVDELALIDDIVNQKPGATNSEKLLMENRCDFSDDLCVQGFRNTPHVDLHMFIPDLKLQFKYFAEHILEAVSLQLETIPSVAISDVLTWFSGFCLAPFSRKKRYECRIEDSDKSLTGNAGKNLKAIILHLLKSIVSAHMDAIVPEMPQVAQILISLCKVSYCDVDFLDSVLRVLDPLICYSLAKASEGHGSLVSHTFCDDFENACFQEIFDHVGGLVEGTDISMETYQGPLIIFLLGTLFSYLSTQRKRAILRFVTSWADFNLLASTSYLDYLKAFENFFNNCNMLIVQSLKLFDVFVPDELQAKEAAVTPKDSEESPLSTFSDSHTPKSRKVLLSLKDMGDISQLLDELFLKIFPSVESCWMLHSHFAHKITVVLGKSYLLKACMISLSSSVDKDGGKNSNDMHFVVSDHLKTAVEGFVMKILALQKDHCWQIASTMLDFLFGLPDIIPLNHVICSICLEIKEFCCRAPRISWRLQSDKWLSLLFNRVRPLCDEESTLLDLFCTMLGHTEPEQRAVALRHLGALVGLDINNGVFKLSYGDFQTEVSSVLCSDTSDKTVFVLVSGLWDKVATLASTDPLLLLRASAIALLSGFIPFTERSQLQSLFASFDSIFPGTGQQICPNQKPLMFLSFSLLARACIYSSKEDILLLPENVWSCLESIAKSNSGVRNMEKKMCEALCCLRNKDGDANEMLTKAFPPTSVGQSDPDFESTRGSLLEVLSTVTSMQSYMDFFSKKLDGEAQELEEAEIELELLMKENASVEAQKLPLKESSILKCQGHLKPSDYIVKLRHEIRELEKGRLRVEVANRRQRKLLAQHTRQKYLEEAASREMELLQELDRERTYEAEREIERQKLLEVERAKTRELRHNLELERERQTQRELQKELEQAESGVQVSRREFPTHTGSGRTRERYRDRDSGRVSNEGSVRSNSRGRENTQASASGPQMPTLVLSGSSRSFSGSVPTILQVRDRSDERGTSYEESFDGSRDSGDTGSVGDPDPASGFDGLSGGFGSGGRQGSRGGKSRQIVERREREGRREGKWERKHA